MAFNKGPVIKYGEGDTKRREEGQVSFIHWGELGRVFILFSNKIFIYIFFFGGGGVVEEVLGETSTFFTVG